MATTSNSGNGLCSVHTREFAPNVKARGYLEKPVIVNAVSDPVSAAIEKTGLPTRFAGPQ